MPTFVISVVKVAETLHDYTVTAKNEAEARKVVIEVAKADEPWNHGGPEIVVDMVIERKDDESS